MGTPDESMFEQKEEDDTVVYCMGCSEVLG